MSHSYSTSNGYNYHKIVSCVCFVVGRVAIYKYDSMGWDHLTIILVKST